MLNRIGAPGQPRGVWISGIVGLALVVWPGGQVAAQEIEEYLGYLPKAQPRAIEMTPESRALQLFGDETAASYRDENPVDGIDDRRGRTLNALAHRFAPFLVQNTIAQPINFRAYWENQVDVPLVIDTWNIASASASLLARETVSIPDLAGRPCSNPATAEGPEDDCTLLKYLRYFYPAQPGSKFMTTGTSADQIEEFRVVYFDLPGGDEQSWIAEFEEFSARFLPERFDELGRLYVHPFVSPAGRGGERGDSYELVLQYWMYYPYNDGGNNHEGDWEHINVVVAPLSSVHRAQTAEEILAMVNLSPGAVEGDGDPLVIRRVEMYFHHWVQTLDYTMPNVYAPRADWQAEVNGRDESTRSEKSFWRLIRRLAYEDEAETRINTHTVGYIGADNKGLDQLIAAPGGRNRDSHGMYPFPGMYKNVGPLGATEQVGAPWFYPKEWFAAGAPDNQDFGRDQAISYHDQNVIQVIPDWERIVDLVQTNAEARAEWFWMVLPLHWGFPAVTSPGAGIVGDADTGNVGPMGPSYNQSWNRAGEAPSYHDYSPHKLASMYPLGWQDNFVNSWGFLNLTGPTLVTLPPLDFIWRVGSWPFRQILGRPDPVYYPNEQLPTRFMGIGPAYSTSFMPEKFAALFLNEEQLVEILVAVVQRDPDLIDQDDLEITTFADAATGPGLRFGFFLSERFSTENLLRHSESQVGLDFTSAILDTPLKVRGTLNMWEYAGSLRYNLHTGKLLPFVNVGWGLTWYQVKNSTIDGQPMQNADGPWIRKPTRIKHLLPNTGHIGAGIEYKAITSTEKPLRGTDIAFRADWSWYFHDLGLREGAGEFAPDLAFLILEGEAVNRHQVSVSLIFGF